MQFDYFGSIPYIVCMRAGKALARLCVCAGSSDFLLVAYAKRSKIACVAHLFHFIILFLFIYFLLLLFSGV